MTEKSSKSALTSKKGIFTDSDLTQKFTITNAIEITFRPVTINDSPLWKEFIEKCSKNSLYSRFQTISSILKEQGELYCQTDYEYTITLGVFINTVKQEQLIGAAWLLKENETNNVELALLIADSWQHKGIGTKLSEMCRNIILKWGVEGVMGTTTLDNLEVKQMLNKNNIAFRNSFGDNSLEFDLSLEEMAL